MPSDTKTILKENMKVVILRNGKELWLEEKLGEEKATKKNNKREKDGKPPQIVKEYKPTIPYLAKLKEDHIDE